MKSQLDARANSLYFIPAWPCTQALELLLDGGPETTHGTGTAGRGLRGRGHAAPHAVAKVHPRFGLHGNLRGRFGQPQTRRGSDAAKQAWRGRSVGRSHFRRRGSRHGGKFKRFIRVGLRSAAQVRALLLHHPHHMRLLQRAALGPQDRGSMPGVQLQLPPKMPGICAKNMLRRRLQL